MDELSATNRLNDPMTKFLTQKSTPNYDIPAELKAEVTRWKMLLKKWREKIGLVYSKSAEFITSKKQKLFPE